MATMPLPARPKRPRGRPRKAAPSDDAPQPTPTVERETKLRKLLVTVDEMAWMLSIGKPKAWQLIMSGQVFSITVGERSRRIPVKCIEEYVESLMASAS